jgi:hypothetical protein
MPNLKPLDKSGNKTDNISNLVEPSTSANSFNNGISKLQGSLQSGIIGISNFSACNFNFYIGCVKKDVQAFWYYSIA